MTFKLYRPLLLLALLASTSSSLFAQKIFDEQSRANFVYDIAKYVQWSNEASLNDFAIGVLEKDNNSPFVEALRKMALEKVNLHEKPIVIKYFSSVDQVADVRLICLNRLSNFEISKVFEKIEGKNILLATENYEFNESMINFIVVKNKLRYELNEAKLKNAGLSVSELFVGLSVKTKDDWESLYRKTDALLQVEKEISAEQGKLIEKQKDEIKQQNERIVKQKAEIEEQIAQIEIQRKELQKLVDNIGKKQFELSSKTKELDQKTELLEQQKGEIDKQQKRLLAKENEIEEKNNILDVKNEEITTKEEKIQAQNTTLNLQIKEIEKQQLILYFFVIIIVFVIGIAYFIYRSYKIKKRANHLLQEKNDEIMKQNEEIRQQKEEIEAQRDEIEDQRDEILKQNHIVVHQKEEIMDSIHYASRIQRAILPPMIFIEAVLSEHYFILNKPRDIVSGDFYWVGKCKESVVALAADCTGHGVPGAFMSMLGVSFLNEIIVKQENTVANEILNELREYVVRALHQTGKEGEAKDGMDMALCVLNIETQALQYAGANNPLYFIHATGGNCEIKRDGAAYPHVVVDKNTKVFNEKYCLTEVKADKMPIGIYLDDHDSFTLNEIQLVPGNAFYIFSDGFADQFGGPKGKKFKYKPFKELLINHQDEPMSVQKEILEKTIVEWQGDLEQVDDIMVIGIKI